MPTICKTPAWPSQRIPDNFFFCPSSIYRATNVKRYDAALGKVLHVGCCKRTNTYVLGHGLCLSFRVRHLGNTLIDYLGLWGHTLLALRGIKAGEPRMRSLGFQPGAHLYTAFVISSFMASVAGVLYVYLNRFVNPVTASLHNNVEAVLMAIVGGSGTLLGPFIGAGLVLGLRNWVSTFFELHLVVMGLVFIAVVIWAPGGVVGLVRRLLSPASKEGQS